MNVFAFLCKTVSTESNIPLHLVLCLCEIMLSHSYFCTRLGCLALLQKHTVKGSDRDIHH